MRASIASFVRDFTTVFVFILFLRQLKFQFILISKICCWCKFRVYLAAGPFQTIGGAGPLFVRGTGALPKKEKRKTVKF